MVSFSVIIPTFNRAKYLSLAIESVLQQRHKGLEIIVVDDGSVDQTPDVAKAYAQRIVYLRQDNCGVSAARNRGIRAARGDWVAFLDSDDEWLPDCLAKHAELVAQYPNIVGSVINAVAETTNGQKTNAFEERKLFRLFQNKRDVLLPRPFKVITDNHVTFLQSCTFRRNVLLSTRLFDEGITIAEDWDVVAQMALKGPFAFCDYVGARVIRREEDDANLSSQLWRFGIKTGLAWARVFERFLQDASLSREEEQSLRKKYASNQRGLGNLYLRMGSICEARAEYLRAFSLDRSAFSFGRFILSFLPPYIGQLLIIKGRYIEPGDRRADSLCLKGKDCS